VGCRARALGLFAVAQAIRAVAVAGGPAIAASQIDLRL
jgi:hypothetical protein